MRDGDIGGGFCGCGKGEGGGVGREREGEGEGEGVGCGMWMRRWDWVGAFWREWEGESKGHRYSKVFLRGFRRRKSEGVFSERGGEPWLGSGVRVGNQSRLTPRVAKTVL